MLKEAKTRNMKNLDKKDWQILKLLCENSRFSHNQIAKKVMLSKNAVTYRIERLKKLGIITGFFTIINHGPFGINFYEILLKINATEDEKAELIKYLSPNENIIVLDQLSGEWDFVMEIGCKNQEDFLKLIINLRNKFSKIIDSFEVHPILYSYKVEQLPIELLENREIKHFQEKVEKKQVKIDKKDKELLLELNKDSTFPLHELAEKLDITYETVSTRIKKLKTNKIIIKNTARISLIALGYDVFLIITDLRNLSNEKEKKLRDFVINNINIRYAFMSASKPQIFIYFAAKNTDALDFFMNNMKTTFPDTIINQKYLISKKQYKYELFTKAMV